MHDTDMIIAYLEEGKVIVLDTWSTKHHLPDNDTILGGSMDYKLLNYTVYSSSSFKVAVSRSLNTGDKYDKQLSVGITTDICWAWYDKNIKDHHGNYGSGTLYMGETTSIFTDESVKYSHHYKKHGIAMTVCWGLLGTLGIFIARYFKQFMLWFWIHFVFGSVILGFTMYSATKTYDKNGGLYSTFDDIQNRHSRIGLILLALTFVQGFLGIASAYLIWRDKRVLQKAMMRKAHRTTGWFMTLFGLWNLWTGWDMYSDDDDGIILAIYIVVGVLFILLETRHQAAQYFPKIKYLDCRRTHLAEITHLQALDKINIEGKKWVFYDEYVLDIAPFVNSHPGGAIFIKEAYGEDMGKYLNGCSSYGENFLPYYHTNQARDLAERLAIAKIPYPEGIFIKKSSQATQDNMTYKLASKSTIARDTILLRLISNELEIQDTKLCPAYFGKHFLITANVKGIVTRRYYSMMLVDYESWTARVLGSQYLTNKVAPPDEDSLAITRGQKVLKLIMKVYEKGILTSYIDNYGPEVKLNMKGPLGPGLGLAENFRGKFMAIVGGTGIITILDLVYYVWNQASENQEHTKDVSLFLYVSFRTSKDAFGVDLIRACAKQCLNITLHVHYSDQDEENQEKLSPEVLRRSYVKEMNKVWICGPSGFNRWASDMVKKEGVKKELIMIL